MKNTAIITIWVTTLMLGIFIVAALANVSLKILIALFVAGTILIPIMVYKVLSDKYATDKDFDDWYEDQPKN